MTAEAICVALDVNPVAVTHARKAFSEGSLWQTLNRKKPDREYVHRLDGKTEVQLIASTCFKAPEGHDR